MTAEEIKELRKSLGMNQDKFAESVGASHRSVVRFWEIGKRKPDRYFTLRLNQLKDNSKKSE